MGFVSIYENRRIKPAEIVLEWGKGGRRRMMERVNPTKILFKHIQISHVSPCATIIC
jgi:hypothetical protein